MRAELPVLSFLCALLLAVALPIHYTRISLAHVSIIVWLLLANLIHGVNSIVWAQNVLEHVPVWCDITTKLLLSVNISIPAALLCMCRHAELLASSRTVLHEGPYERSRTLLEVACCMVLPLVYAALHTIVQDRRFNIVMDSGCEPSIFPSTLSIILVWLPPLALCIIALTLVGLSLAHVFHRRNIFAQHLAARTHLSAKHFYRLLAISSLQLTLLIVFFVFSIASSVGSGLHTWSSWSSVHANFSDIIVRTSPLPRGEFAWWMIPSLSLLSLVGFAIDDARGLLRALAAHMRRPASGVKDTGDNSWIDFSDLPRHAKNPAMVSSPLITPSLLQSNWDDSIKSKTTRPYPAKLKVDTELTSESSYSRACSPEDDAFAMSTMSYLQSPTGKDAAYLPNIRPPSLYMSPISDASSFSDEPHPPPPALTRSDYRKSEAPSGTSLILHASWPVPPQTFPVSPSAASVYSQSSSATATLGHAPPVVQSSSPLNPCERPFDAPGCAVDAVPPLLERANSRQARRMASKRELRGHRSDEVGPGDVIYMTVVQETV